MRSLSEIKSELHENGIYAPDTEWLIAKIERLQRFLAEVERLHRIEQAAQEWSDAVADLEYSRERHEPLPRVESWTIALDRAAQNLRAVLAEPAKAER